MMESKKNKRRSDRSSLFRLEDLLLDSFDEDVISITEELYKRISPINKTFRGCPKQIVYVSCLYLAQQLKGKPITVGELFKRAYPSSIVDDLSETSKGNLIKDKKSKVLSLSNRIKKENELDIGLLTPEDYLDSICERVSSAMNIPKDELKLYSEELLDDYVAKGGRIYGRPSCHAISFVYMAASNYRVKPFTFKEVDKIFDISLMTVRKKVKEIEKVLGREL